VQYAYTEVRPTNGRYAVRRTSSTYPGSYVVSNVYSTGTGTPLDDVTSRVTSVTLAYPDGSGGTTTTGDRIAYRYLGAAQLVGTAYPEPDATHNFYTVPSSVAVYGRLDEFNRIVGDVWTHAGTGTAHDLTLAYDRNGNITKTIDNRHQANGTLAYSHKYDMDDLNRVAKADRGVWSGSAITGSIRNTEEWSLSQTGNWLNDRVNLNGDSDYTDTGEFNETRTSNAINQILTRSTQSNNPVYNQGGQLTDDGKSYKHVYDAFGRLIKLTDRATPASTKAEYRYNGLGQRVAYKLNGTGTWHDLVQDEQWREVAVVDRTNNKLLERTLYHNAGLNGRGGSSYIDSCAIRETNPTTGTYPVMQNRWYTLQNWRADVVATLASDGTLSAWSSYTAYGKQQTWRVADVDDGTGNGVPDEGLTIDDLTLYLAWFEVGDPRADVDDGTGTGALDAGVTIDDLLFYMAYFESGGGDFDSRLGYAGYVKDEAGSGQSGLYHVRYRVYSTELGVWHVKDLIGYRAGENLYSYARSMSIRAIDPFGLEGDYPPGITPPANPLAPIVFPDPFDILKPQQPNPFPFNIQPVSLPRPWYHKLWEHTQNWFTLGNWYTFWLIPSNIWYAGIAWKFSAFAYQPLFSPDDREGARHCLWQAMLTYLINEEVATNIGNHHEFGQQDCADSRRDQYNNLVGRGVGKDAKSSYPNKNSDFGFALMFMMGECSKKVKDGTLIGDPLDIFDPRILPPLFR
jgi:RHS repeat-associated protein